MATEEDIEFLKNYQKWRKGSDEIRQPNPSDISNVLDRLIKFHENLNKNINEIAIFYYPEETLILTEMDIGKFNHIDDFYESLNKKYNLRLSDSNCHYMSSKNKIKILKL